MADSPLPPLPSGFGQACPAITHAIADSLAFEEILKRVADAARLVIPFTVMGIWHAAAPDDPVRLRLAPGTPGDRRRPERPLRRSDHSPQLWPQNGSVPVCISDAVEVLDPTHLGDRLLIELGYRATLVLPLDDAAKEVLWFAHSEPNAYTTTHARMLQPVTDLARLAVSHDHLHTLMQERRRKRDALEALLPTLASALDMQAVFTQISEIIKDVLPHDYLRVGLITEDGRGFKLHATSLGRPTDAPEYRPQSQFWQATKDWEYFIVQDFTPVGDGSVRTVVWHPIQRRSVTTEFTPDPYFLKGLLDHNMRSQLRLPIRLQGKLVAFLFLTDPRPYLYGEEDAELGRRVADHLALALAHERLAEEVKRTTQAQRQAAQLQERVDALVEELEGVVAHRALGRSGKWRDILSAATRVAETDSTVLITGESGTGKEVVARYIHRASRRDKRPFVALNCAALPEQLLESELFGYERGAFTGAQTSRQGRIEQAAGGTLFLDEVAGMSTAVQAKFLRVLQEREFQRLGGSATLRADVRVIAATNRDPRLAMERGTLREDLYYRLNVFELVLPPLRERAEDILVLAEAFLEEIGRGVGRPAAGFSKDARDSLLNHGWPGNVRELRNAIERAAILCDGGLITGEHLPMAIGTARARSVVPATPAAPVVPSAPTVPAMLPAEGVNLDAMEREMIEKAMTQAKNNKSEAARLLGLARGQLYSRLKRYGMTRAKR